MGANQEKTVLTRYIEYSAASTEWLREEIKDFVNKFDIRGLTNGRIEAVNIHNDHPLVKITGAILGAVGSSSLSSETAAAVAGILPAISIVHNAEDNNEVRFLGAGDMRDVTHRIDLASVNEIRSAYPDEKKRQIDGLISNRQLDMIESRIRTAAQQLELSVDAISLACEVQGFRLRETVALSLWCAQMDDFLTLHRLFRSAVFGVLPRMRSKNLRDMMISADTGLRNFNFGETLLGSETTVTFLNHFATITVFEEVSVDADLPLVITMDLADIAGTTDATNEGGDWAAKP